MSGIPVTPDVIRILRDEKTRGFRIDVETNQTSQPDDDVEKQQTIEMITALTQYLQAAGQVGQLRSEEHTSELQSLMRTSYAVICLKKKTKENKPGTHRQ